MNRHVGKHSRRGDDLLVAHAKGDFTFQDVEAFLFSAMDMRWWTAAWRHNRLPQGVFAVHVLAHCKEATHVADDSDGSAFTGFLRSLHHVYLLRNGNSSSVVIASRCRAMARLRKNEIIHKISRASMDFA